MTDITPERRDELRRIAEAVPTHFCWERKGQSIRISPHQGHMYDGYTPADEFAAFIAEAKPSVVLALLDHITKVEADLDLTIRQRDDWLGKEVERADTLRAERDEFRGIGTNLAGRLKRQVEEIGPIILARATAAEAETASLRALVAKAEEALRPFALLHAESPSRPSDQLAWGYNDADVTWGELRRAASVHATLRGDLEAVSPAPELDSATGWLRENATVYRLFQRGWRRGEPVMVNETTISVHADPASEVSADRVAEHVRALLNAYPVLPTPPAPTSGGEP